ncbi:EAL domain-containing protein [Citreimonas salinaria]|uniref:Diguanylate cyclase/phosphodiesterase n=1 Tax=Citreimonas salinaria TaxID=321339 RepID=A0A1H3KI54_9RHOB|nr:EAL domain-containing protein [Citreimonas salinaria]SDY51861.1 diguanylate cyclase/phosphodiesterase [Citreimonas salinaria]
MTRDLSNALGRIGRAFRHGLHGPQALAFIPALTLAAFWLGGETVLVACALGLPALYALAGWGSAVRTPAPVEAGGDVVDTAAARALVDRRVNEARAEGLGTACLLFDVAGLTEVARKSGDMDAEPLREMVLMRLRGLLRRGDTAVRIGDSRFMVLAAPSSRSDLESLLQMSARLQSAVEEPASTDTTVRHLTANIGFCATARLPGTPTGERLFDAAQVALAEAARQGPSAIRAWSDTIAQSDRTRRSLTTEVRAALENGQIQPWFQPQICTSTGDISGVEALARWIHPQRGIVPPAQFLRCLEEAGLDERLTEIVLQHSLNALRSWDQADVHVPRASLNFARGELASQSLVERVEWELDRFGLTPMRLGIEVSEGALGIGRDVRIVDNLVALRRVGCYLELDDFGAGQAPLTALTALPFDRIKIDRSHVSRVDRDERQRRMLAGILGLAERLELDTLAEGVESVGEHALLAQLGCGHVQGFGIVRAMPADELAEWSRTHRARIAEAQRLGRDAR